MEEKLKRMQKKEEEKQKRIYEREVEKERRNVFNFLNRTIGNQSKDANKTKESEQSSDIKLTSSKDLNIEQFKITEDTKKLARDILKLKSSISRHSEGTPAYRHAKMLILDKEKELDLIKNKEQRIIKEQQQRKDKQKMTVF